MNFPAVISDDSKAAKKVTVVIPCEVFTRVTGFYRPVNQFNAGKKEEFRERKYISISESKELW